MLLANLMQAVRITLDQGFRRFLGLVSRYSTNLIFRVSHLYYYSYGDSLGYLINKGGRLGILQGSEQLLFSGPPNKEVYVSKKEAQKYRNR